MKKKDAKKSEKNEESWSDVAESESEFEESNSDSDSDSDSVSDSSSDDAVEPMDFESMEAFEEYYNNIRGQVNDRCKEIEEEANRRAEYLQLAFKRQLLLLPDRIAKMNYKVFMHQYDGNIDSVIREDKKLAMQRLSNSPKNTKLSKAASEYQPTVKKRRAEKTESKIAGADKGSRRLTRSQTARMSAIHGNVESHAGIHDDLPAHFTPRQTKRNVPLPTPGTALRKIKSGEVLYSQKGSPVAVAPSMFGSQHSINATSAVLANEVDKLMLNYANPNSIDSLTDESRDTARQNIQAIHAKIAQLVKQLS